MASVSLTHGNTEYELAGPDAAPLVVLLHGASIPLWTWDAQISALHAAGFRTLRYDMYGRGKSAYPRTLYDRELYQRQLLELLDALTISTPFHLVGFSFGGATAANFCASHPDRVKSLALIAPVFHFAEGNALVRVARTPIVGELFMRFVVMRKAAMRAAKLWAGGNSPQDYASRFEAQIRRAGYAAAFLSFLRSDALDDYAPVYGRLGSAGRRALLVWGTDDGDIPVAHIASIRQLMPLAEFHELPAMGHGVVFQAAREVNRLLVGYLSAN